MVALFIEQARIPISRYNLRKFYALSKKPIALEQAECGSTRAGAYFTLDLDEMIEFIWRIAQYVFSAESYGIDAAADVECSLPPQEDGNPAPAEAKVNQVPEVISCMFDKTKF